MHYTYLAEYVKRNGTASHVEEARMAEEIAGLLVNRLDTIRTLELSRQAS